MTVVKVQPDLKTTDFETVEEKTEFYHTPLLQVALCCATGGETSQLSHPEKKNRGHVCVKAQRRDAAAVDEVQKSQQLRCFLLFC